MTNCYNCDQSLTTPYQATIDVKTNDGSRDGGSIVATFTSDASGNFSVKLSPGTYVLSPRSVSSPGSSSQATASPQKVTVTTNHYTEVTITYQ
jgi:hypothetical protein